MKVNLETAEVIGEGNFAKIYKFFSKEHKTYLAARSVTINKDELEELEKQKEINRELMKVNSPYILKIYGIEESQTHILYFTEYCQGGSLFQCLDSLPNHLLQVEPAVSLVVRIAKGIQVLHNNKITHRDLKPQNILLVKRHKPGHEVPDVKIADFGLSTNNIIMKTLAGTKEYIAPQQAKYHNYTNAVDVWALGIILDEMLHGTPFFTGESNDDVFKKVTTEQFIVRNKFLPQGIQDLLVQMLKKKAFQRPTIGQVINKLENILSTAKTSKIPSPGLRTNRSIERIPVLSCKEHNNKAEYLRQGQPYCEDCVNVDLIPIDVYLKYLPNESDKLFKMKLNSPFSFRWDVQSQLQSIQQYTKLFKQLKTLFSFMNTSSIQQPQCKLLQQTISECLDAKSHLNKKQSSLIKGIEEQFCRQLELQVQEYINNVLS